MNNLRKVIAVAIFMLIVSASYGQMAVTYYSKSIIAVNTDVKQWQNTSLMGELKLFTNTEVEDMDVELDLLFRFEPRKYHRFAAGVGFKVNPFESDDEFAITVPVSMEVFPFQDFKKVSFLIEASPEIFMNDPMKLRSGIGVRYTFGAI